MVAPLTTLAQQQSLYTQYMFNGLVINPAYSATDDAMNITLLHRQQWIGLDGAPQTTTASVHSPLIRNKLSAGLLITHDKIGVTSGSGFELSLAPNIRLTNKVNMALGLSAGARYGITNNTSLDFTSDPLFAQNEDNLYTMLGAGVMIYGDNFFAGLSLPQLIAIKARDYNNGITANRYFNYMYATGGVLIPLTDNVQLKPHTLFWYADNLTPQLDINLNAIIQQRLWVGISWRSMESIAGIIQAQLNRNIQVGYSYDAGSSVSRHVSKGSHELLLNVRFMKDKRRILSTRWY